MSSTSSASRSGGHSPVWVTWLALVGTWTLARALGRDPVSAEGMPALSRKPLGARLRGWGFWKHILIRVYNEIMEDRLLSLAAGVVFYGLLALFPAITALVSCYALFADPATISSHLAILKNVMPGGGYGIVQSQIHRIATSTTGDLSLAFFGSLAIALWSANAGMKAIIDALNIVYGVKELRSFVRLNIVSLAMTMATIIGLLLAIAAIVVTPIVLSYLPLGGFGAAALALLRWPALILLLMVAIAVLYRFGPNCTHPRWEWISVGGVVATLAWLVGSLALSWYLSDFANYNATYGSLGAGVGLMMWLWVTAIAILVGAELNSEIAASRTHVAKSHAGGIGGDKPV